MNLAEWRAVRAEGEEAELPCGLTVKLRRVSALDLAQQGKIPSTLQPQVDKFLSKSQQQGVKLSLTDLKEFLPVVTLVCKACIVEPEELDVEELPVNDRMAVFGWANEGAGRLTTFRKSAKKSVEPAFNGSGVRAEAE